MSLPWSAVQVEWLQAMGFDVLGLASAPVRPSVSGDADVAVPAALARAARGVDLAPLLATLGMPRDAATRRAFWRALRPLRKAAAAR